MYGSHTTNQWSCASILALLFSWWHTHTCVPPAPTPYTLHLTPYTFGEGEGEGENEGEGEGVGHRTNPAFMACHNKL